MSFFAPHRPYPPECHTGDPEVSARWRPVDTAPDLLGAGGSSCHYLVTGDGSNGDFGLYRWDMGARRGGPAPHVHRTISESFFVLDGVLALHDGTCWREAHPGDFLYVPPGGIHGFRNDSDAPASMLLLFAPGAPREAYFEGLQHLAETAERPDDDTMAEFCRLHDTYWVDA